ncbi:MAG: extracellular solute-binding protein [Tepidisphaeraceae bacterium]
MTLRLEVPPAGIRGPNAAAERAVLTAFSQANPDIRIDPYVRLRMQGPRAEATLYMAMAGQSAPDALYVNARSMQKFIEQGFLCPLDEYLSDEIRADPLFQKLLPTFSRDGRVYAIPARVAAAALLYRKDLFADVGLDPERPPATWDELLAMSRRLTLPERGQYGIVLPGGADAGWRFTNFVWQAGGEMVRRTGTGWRLALDEPPAVAALKFYRELRWGTWQRDGKDLQGCMRVDSTGQSIQHVVEGRAAMTIISTTGDIGKFIPDPAIMGIAPLPAGPAGRAAMLEGEFWGINSMLASDAARRDAAWRYIRFVSSDEARRIQTRSYVESGAASSVPPDWFERFGYASELQSLPRAWVEFSRDLLKDGRLEPYAPGYDQVATDLLSQLDEVLYGEDAEPRQVLAAISDRGNAAFFAATPPQVVSRRRTVARGVASALAIAAAAIVVWRIRGRRGTKEREHSGNAGHQQSASGPARLAILFLAPAVLTILVWDYYPLVRGAVLAFMDYRVTGASRFVGLDNFISVFTQESFWRALGQTFVYVAISLGIGFVLPIVLAMLLSEITWGRMLFRTLFYLPAVTSGVIVLSIWKMMYDGSPQGVFNRVLSWMAGTNLGRLFTLATFAVLWWVVVSAIVVAVIDRIATRGMGSDTLASARARRWKAGAGAAWGTGVAAMLPIWPGGGLLGAGWLGGWNLSTPIAFVVHGALAGAGVVTLAGIVARFASGRMSETGADGEQARRLHVRRLKTLAIVGAGVVGVALAWHLSRLLTPLDRPYPWLQDPTGFWAMLWVIVPGIWAGVGPACIIYLAALKSIPDELYEAADLDGAGPVQKAWHVTIHSLLPLVLINFVGAVIGTFQAMESVLVLTGGGPGTRTMTLGLDVFFNAFTHLKFGYATAQAWVMGSLLIGFTVYQLRTLREMKFRRAGAS